MSLKLLLLFTSGAILNTAFGALDLTPITKEHTEEGVTYREVTFKNGEGIVKFFPPDGWILRGQGLRLQLTPPKKDSSEGIVEVTALAAAPPLLDEATTKAFKEKVLATLPGGSSAIAVLYEAENSLMPGGRPSLEVAISYQLWGRTYQRSALLVNGPREQVVFRFTAPKEDFTPLLSAFRRSIASWQWIEPPGVATVAQKDQAQSSVVR